MAGEASTQDATSERLESNIEINIKTLDSNIYSFRVNKDMPIPVLKEKLADVTGVPVERQRLIFRGKVLKDDHLLSEYHLEDGHTLHLVARQPVDAQSSSGMTPESSVQEQNNQGTDFIAGAPRQRIGQVSHSVLLGTVNVADQGESMVPDINRLVGAVLNSLGVGPGVPTGSASGTPSATPSNQETPSNTERNQNASATPLPNLPPPGFTIPNNPFPSMHQIPIPPFMSTGFVPPQMTVPDSLTTLSEYISRMAIALQNNGPHPSPPTNSHDRPRTESPSLGGRGLPTPEVLQTVLEQAQQLLRVNAATALSRVATRLEREGTSADPVVRGQIQDETMHAGVAMQHLGAMLLELGRTMMTLRMGQSPADSIVNAGPAVYISSAGPNPIMVQPFPVQTSSLFGAPPPTYANGVSGPIPMGDISRNINIHIHAGSPFIPGGSNAVARASSGEAMQGEHTNSQQASRDGNAAGDSTATRGFPSRTVVAAIPARPTGRTAGHVLSVLYPVQVSAQPSVSVPAASAHVSNPTVSNGAQPSSAVVSQPPSETGILPTIIEQISAQVTNALARRLGSSTQNVQSAVAQGSHAESGMTGQVDQTPSEANTSSLNVQEHNSFPNVQSTESQTSCIGGTLQASPDLSASELAEADAEGNTGNFDAGEGNNASVITNDPVIGMPRGEGQKLSQESSCEPGKRGLSGMSDTNVNSSATTSTNNTVQSGQGSDCYRPTPLGLGLGGLQPKRQGKTSKPVGKGNVLRETPSDNQDQQYISRGQQFLHSLASQTSNIDRENTNDTSNLQTTLTSQSMDGLTSSSQGTTGRGQVDAAGMMSHILRTPAFSNLLTGVAEQTGIGSSDDLRSMLEQCTQSPAVRNTLNGIAQQVERRPESVGAMFSGLGSGQGGFDLSTMIQQMMPVVSQALGGGSSHSEPALSLETAHQTHSDDGGNRISDLSHDRSSQVDLERAVEGIEQLQLPGNIFRSVLESAGQLIEHGDSLDDNLLNSLVNNEELTGDFMRMLCRDLHRRMQTDSTSEQ